MQNIAYFFQKESERGSEVIENELELKTRKCEIKTFS